MDDIALRRLSGEPVHITAVQRVLEDAPAYALLSTGLPPGPADARTLFAIRPPGRSADDKFVFGIALDDELIGCVDLIRAYPDARHAHIGLLLLAERHQGRGIGAQVVDRIATLASTWTGCTHLRLGVLRSNVRATAFWTRRGFVATGEVAPWRHGRVVSESVVMTRPLR